MRTALLLVLGLLPAALSAQEEASTLVQLAAGADVVVVADVLARTDPDPERHELRFRTVRLLKGDLPERFTLQEPAGACCGRALFAMLPGTGQLLFLQRRDGALHLLTGARGAASPAAAQVEHVRQLLAATTAPQRLAVLGAGLHSEHERVRRDAVLALAADADLPAAAPALRAAVAALAEQAFDAVVPDAALPHLVTVGARLAEPRVLQLLVEGWVRHERADLRRLGETGIRGFAPDAAAAAVARAMPADEAGRLRGIDLLACLPADASRPVLLQLLRTAPLPRIQVRACRLLLQNGTDAAELGPLVPAEIVALARELDLPPRLRAVRPEPRR